MVSAKRTLAVTAKLISAFVFAIRIVQSLYYLDPKYQVSSHLVWLYSPVCVGPDRKPRRPAFSQRGSYTIIPAMRYISLFQAVSFFLAIYLSVFLSVPFCPFVFLYSSCGRVHIFYLSVPMFVRSSRTGNLRQSFGYISQVVFISATAYRKAFILIGVVCALDHDAGDPGSIPCIGGATY